MARLVNVSSKVQYVGGWQKNQIPAGQVVRVKLMPGESVEIPPEVRDDPAVVVLAETADFELQDVTLVAGGPTEADPKARKGEMKLIRKVIDYTSFANDAVASKSVVIDLLPSGSMITDVRLRHTAPFDDSMALELGSSVDPDSVLLSEALTGVAALIKRSDSLTQLDFVTAGFPLEAKFTVAGTLDNQTGGSVEILVSFFVC
jgi:hypothetical protein